MRRLVGTIAAMAGALAALAPASAMALETRELRVAEPVERECAERLLPAGTAGLARTSWIAPAEGYLTLKLGGDPYAPDWDLAARSEGATYASTNSGSTEVVTLWVREGDRVALQACRLAGGDRNVPLTIEFYGTALPRPGDERVSLESVALDRPSDLTRLESLGVDVGHDVTPDYATALVYSDEQRQLVAANGFDTITKIYDVARTDRKDRRAEARAAGARAGGPDQLPSGQTAYRQYNEFTEDMKALVDTYPGHVRPLTLGLSLEGRPIEGVEIAGNVNATDDGRPVYVNMGAHHAREWPSAEFPMEFAVDLAQSYGSDPRITSMLDRVRVIIVPVVNPDGYVASRSYSTTPLDDLPPEAGTLPLIVANSGAYRRKNCRPGPGEDARVPCAQRVGGVDLNRNYGAYWGGPGGSTDPTMQTYRGTGPYSEPESQAVLQLSESIHPTVFISNHTVTPGEWYRPPGFNRNFFPDDPPSPPNSSTTPDESAMKALGDAMAQASEPDFQSVRGWTTGSIAAATEDWNYFAQGTYGYTPEHRGENFHSNFTTMVVGEYLGGDSDRNDFDGIRGAFVIAGEEAADTDNHGIIEGTAPPGATLRIQKAFSLPTCENTQCDQGNGEPVDYEIDTHVKVPASGQFSWHVNQSTRPDVYENSNPPQEAWTMTCKQDGQERSVAQQVLIDRGQRKAVDWSGLCGSVPAGSPGGGDGTGPGGDGGGVGDDRPTCRGKDISIIGTPGTDKIIGTARPDVILALNGDDTVIPGKGKDIVCGDSGGDTVKGGDSADLLLGQAGDDLLNGGKGNDEIRGASGEDRLAGGKGKDTCVGGSSRDTLSSCD